MLYQGNGNVTKFNRLMIQYPSATLFRRLAATFYDAMLVFAVLAALTFIVVTTLGDAVPSGNIFFQFLLTAATAVYFSGFWVTGQTPGMRTWKLRLVTQAGQRISWQRALIRFAVAIPSTAIFGLGFLWAIFDADKQTLHDRIAKTRLVVIQ